MKNNKQKFNNIRDNKQDTGWIMIREDEFIQCTADKIQQLWYSPALKRATSENRDDDYSDSKKCAIPSH